MMLGRTAANLFWLSRYVERAENVARLIEAGYRMSLINAETEARAEDLVSMMQALSVDTRYFEKFETTELRTVVQFMIFDEDNPSSIKSCLRNARNNARTERTSLTSDMWESINGSWLDFSQMRATQSSEKYLPDLLTWVKKASHQWRGALLGTVLRSEGFAYSQLGNFVERADNTARILDMKYYVLLPRATVVGGELDLQQWALILRATSAYRSYRHVYHDRFRAWNIADYLILRPEMPRSLMFCTRWVQETLEMLEVFHGGRSAAHEVADQMSVMLEGNDMDQIFSTGLHEFLSAFLGRNHALTEAIGESYGFY